VGPIAGLNVATLRYNSMHSKNRITFQILKEHCKDNELSSIKCWLSLNVCIFHAATVTERVIPAPNTRAVFFEGLKGILSEGYSYL
jgi:hypothetical protein